MKTNLVKKIVIGVLAAVLLGGGVFLFLQKEKMGEDLVQKFVDQHLGKPYHIRQLEQNPSIQEATFTLSEYSTDSARSVFRLSVIDFGGTREPQKIEIPFVSKIERGASEHKGTKFGFAHIVSRPDLSAFSKLPEQIKENFFRVESFIGNDGSLRNVFIAEPITYSDKAQLVFEGGELQHDTSVFHFQNFVLNLALKKVSIKDKDEVKVLEFQPFSFFAQFKDGKYDGKTARWEGSVLLPDNQIAIRLSEILFNGEQKFVEDCKLDVGFGFMQCKEFEVKNSKGVHFRLENIEAEGGGSEKGKDLFTIAGRFDCTPKLVSPAILPPQTDIQKVGMRYEASGITTEILNHLADFNQGFVELKIDENNGVSNAENPVNKLLQAVQKANIKMDYSFFVKEAKGEATVKGTVALSEAGKKVDIKEIMQNGVEKFLDIQIDFSCNKVVADALNLTMILQMQPQYFQFENDVFTSQLVLKDGAMKVNGNLLP